MATGEKRRRANSQEEDSLSLEERVLQLEKDQEEMKKAQQELKADNLQLQDRVEKAEKRIARNEAHSRQRNLRIYKLPKAEVDKMKDGVYGALREILEKGLKINKQKVGSIMSNVDIAHWTTDEAIIVAFCRRSDLKFIRSQRGNLKDYKFRGSQISLEDDLTREDLVVKRECREKLKEMKKDPAKYKEPKIFSFNQISCGSGTAKKVKHYSEW